MAIERSDIEKVAELARLSISEQALNDTTETISQILALVDQMQAVNTDSIEPLAHPLDEIARLREDAVTEADQHEHFQKIAPATEAGLYLVPKVIE